VPAPAFAGSASLVRSGAALAVTLAARDAIEPVKALQQSGNGGEAPLAALCRWYPSLVQLASGGRDGDKAPFRSLRIVGPTASARTSATRLLVRPMLRLAMPRRVSILAMVVRCQLAPKTVGIPLRFNSSAISRWATKPSALSVRMVEAKASARESAARLFVEAPCTLRPRDDVTPLNCSIGQSWPAPDVLSQR
jgi:hypothetical protein